MHFPYGGMKNGEKKNYKMNFFFFILVRGDQTEPHAASQETPWSWWERELSDYCFGQWLASVWGRAGEKKGESERGTEGGRAGGKEGGNEGGRDGGRRLAAAAAVWKSRRGENNGGKKEKKLLGALFTGRTLGLEETRGSRASHQLPHMSFTRSFEQYSAPPDCIREARQWNGRPLQPVRPVHWSAGAVLTHPEGPRLTQSPSTRLALFLCVFVMLFSPPQAIFFSPAPLLRRLSRVRGRRWPLVSKGSWEG